MIDSDNEDDKVEPQIATDNFKTKALAWLTILKKKGEISFTEAGKGNPFRSPEGISLLACQVVEFWLYFGFVLSSDPRLSNNPDTKVKFGGSYIDNIIKAQKVVAIICIFIAAYAFLFTVGSFLGDNMTRLFNLVLLKAAMICVLNTFLMAFFVASRLILLGVISLFQLLAVIVCFKLNWKITSAAVDEDGLRDVPTIMRALLSMRMTEREKDQSAMPLSLHLLEQLLAWLSGWDAARTLNGDGRKHLTRIGVVALLLSLATFSFDFSIMNSSDIALLSEEDFQWITDNASQDVPGWSYDNTTGLPLRLKPASGYGTNKIVLLMFDGWGFHDFNRSEAMTTLRNDAELSPDMTLLKLQDLVPTTDVPTWQQIISGVNPETSGVRGDYRIGSTDVDTIFHQINRTNTLAGVSSVPWFTYLFKDVLEPLHGDGAVSSEFRLKPGLRGFVKDEDEVRGDAIINAMKSTTNYAFLLGHFFTINYNAHVYGTADNEFEEAMNNATKIVESVIRNVTDTSVVVVVVGNHGHVQGGGSGGISDSVIHVPLLVYKKDSNLATQTYPIVYARDFDDTRNSDYPWLIDLCPTLAALVGVPIPRHNQGFFIDELMTSTLVHPDFITPLQNDLFTQLQCFTKRWFQRMGYTPNQFVFNSSYLNSTLPGPVPGAMDLLNLHTESRWQNRRNLTSRNLGGSILIIFTVSLVFIYVFQTLTIADPFAVLWVTVHPRLQEWLQTPDFRSTKLALICICSYYALVWFSFAFCASILGQGQFDSSFLHSSFSQIFYLCLVFIPGLLTISFLGRAVRMQVSKPAENRETSSLLVAIWNWLSRFFLEKLNVTDVAFLHVFHLYLLFFSLLTTMSIFLASSMEYNFIVPNTFRLGFLSDQGWKKQFQLMTSIGVCAPLLFYSLLEVVLWGSQPIDSYVLYEINRFRAEKARRYQDVLSVNLGEPTQQAWEMPNIEEPEGDNQGTKPFARLSDWCFEVLKSSLLSQAEKRRIIAKEYSRFAGQARRFEQEKSLVRRQLESVISDYNATQAKVIDMDKRIQENKELTARGVQALRELVQKEMEAEVKERASKNKKVAWRADPEKEENRRMGAFLINKIREHEQQRMSVLVEDRKAWLMAQVRSSFEQEVANAQKQRRDVVDQTLELSKQQDALDEELASLNAQLEEQVARMKEHTTVKKRIAEVIRKDIQVHTQIQKEIEEELRREADYHMYVHKLIDDVSDEIFDKQARMEAENTSSKEVADKAERRIEELREKIARAQKDKLELFREVQITTGQITKTKHELTNNIRWAEEFKQKLAEIAQVM